MWQSFVVDDQKQYFAYRELRHPDYRFVLFDPQLSLCYIEIVHKTNAVDRAEALNRHLSVKQQMDANHLNELLLTGSHDAASEYHFPDDDNDANDSKGVKLIVQMVYKQKDNQFFRYFWHLRRATQEEFCDALFKPALQSISEINRQNSELRFALCERDKKPWLCSFDFRSFDTKYEDTISRANSLLRLGGISTTPSPQQKDGQLSSKSALDELHILNLNLCSMCKQMAKHQMEAYPSLVVEKGDIRQSFQSAFTCKCDYCRKQRQEEQQQEARKARARKRRERLESRQEQKLPETRDQREHNPGSPRNARKQQKYQEIQSVDDNTVCILHKNPMFQCRSESSSSSAPENEQSRLEPECDDERGP